MAEISGKLNLGAMPPDLSSSSSSSSAANCNGSSDFLKGASDLEGISSVVHARKPIRKKPPRCANGAPAPECDSLKKYSKPENGQSSDGCLHINEKNGDVSSQKDALGNSGLISESPIGGSLEKSVEHHVDVSGIGSSKQPLKLADLVLGDLDDCCCEEEVVGERNCGLISQSSASASCQSTSNCLHYGSQCAEAKDSFVTAEASDGTESAAKSSGSIKASGPCGDQAGSGKSSICRGSTSSDVSDESNLSSFSATVNKPHKGNDSRWDAIKAIRLRDGFLGLNHFKLLKRLGCGDIGSVYLSELSGTRNYFAIKVMDKEALASRKKLPRAQTEREILQSLDHPFLPTLYTHFETQRFSCLVMEFCPGGDLHVLRQRQPGKCFPEYAARFYVAEVLLALEYLHMLGIVYRDLKPENVL